VRGDGREYLASGGPGCRRLAGGPYNGDVAELNLSGVDYPLLEQQVAGLLEQERNFIANAANFAALVYESLPAVNWAGFYFPAAGGELLLGPFAGKPACARLPEGRGVCGKAFALGRPLIVDDVQAFSDHIACDSASRSELVLPLVENGMLYGVFDLDSPETARFTAADAAGVQRLIQVFLQHTDLPQEFRRELLV
jgi:GAF domain-containing protein